jgi:hypothetical protein
MEAFLRFFFDKVEVRGEVEEGVYFVALGGSVVL